MTSPWIEALDEPLHVIPSDSKDWPRNIGSSRPRSMLGIVEDDAVASRPRPSVDDRHRVEGELALSAPQRIRRHRVQRRHVHSSERYCLL